MPDVEAFNYFNYFTEVEERFQQARGTALFLMSPLDWALVETWKDQGVPLEAVLRGIDAAFEKWRAKKTRTQQVNSLAYCAQAVMEEARRIERPHAAAAPTMDMGDIGGYLRGAAAKLPAGFEGVRDAVLELAGGDWTQKLEELEQRLTALEEKALAQVRAAKTEEELFELRRTVEGLLKPYRAKMDAANLMLTEKKFLDQRLFETSGLPRLSLFYMG